MQMPFLDVNAAIQLNTMLELIILVLVIPAWIVGDRICRGIKPLSLGRDAHCAECGYSLYGISVSSACPECHSDARTHTYHASSLLYVRTNLVIYTLCMSVLVAFVRLLPYTFDSGFIVYWIVCLSPTVLLFSRSATLAEAACVFTFRTISTCVAAYWVIDSSLIRNLDPIGYGLALYFLPFAAWLYSAYGYALGWICVYVKRSVPRR